MVSPKRKPGLSVETSAKSSGAKRRGNVPGRRKVKPPKSSATSNDTTPSETTLPDSGYAAMLESVRVIAESLTALNQRAAREYAPVVEAILRSRNRDTRHIEQTLDGLLDFCGHKPVLLLYKKLCRYYFTIHPAATAYYIHAYREMWGSEEKANPP